MGGYLSTNNLNEEREKMHCYYCYKTIMKNSPLVKVYSYGDLDGVILCRTCLYSPTRRENLRIIINDINKNMVLI